MLGILLLALAVYSGILIAGLLKDVTLLERTLLGIMTGLVALMWVSFLFFLGTGSFSLAFWGSLLLFVVVSFTLTWKFNVKVKTFQNAAHNLLNALRHNYRVVLFFVLLGVFLSALFFIYVLVPRADGLYGGVNSWGDTPMHLGLINHFRYGARTLEYPVFLGEKLTYPFLFDFLTAVLTGPGGLDLRLAIVLFGIALSLIIVLSIYAFSLRLVKSRKVAVLAIVLFLFSGGVGFIYYFQDAMDSGSLDITKDYSRLDYNKMSWGNFMINYLLPQRTFTIGFPIGLLVVILLMQGILGKMHLENLLFAGVLAGTLPMIHAHNFLAVAIISAIFAVMFFSWEWVFFFIPMGLAASPQMLWIMSRISDSFIRIHLGFTSEASTIFEWAYYWARNVGVLLFLGIIGTYNADRKTKRLLLPFWFLFILGNLVIFQPWDFDNAKFMQFWWLVLSLMGSVAVFGIAERGRRWKLVAVLLVVVCILSGFTSVYYAFTQTRNIFSTADIELGDWIRDNTPPDSIFLTVYYHNDPTVPLGGRRILSGFGGWMWTHGIRYEEREADVNNMLSGGPEAKSLLEKYKVSYAVLRPGVSGMNDSFYQENFERVWNNSAFNVYRTG